MLVVYINGTADRKARLPILRLGTVYSLHPHPFQRLSNNILRDFVRRKWDKKCMTTVCWREYG